MDDFRGEWRLQEHEWERIKWRVEQTYNGVCILMVALAVVIYKVW